MKNKMIMPIMPLFSKLCFSFTCAFFLAVPGWASMAVIGANVPLKCTFLNLVSSQFLKLILNFDLIHVQNHGKFLQFTTRPQLVGLCQLVVCICSELKKKM